MIKYTEEQILELILGKFDNQKVLILSPLVNNRKGHYKELFEQLRRKGYLNVRVDGELQEIVVGMRLDRYKNHNIELVVLAEIAHAFFHPIGIGIKVGIRSLLEVFQLLGRILKRQPVIVQSLILRHCIGISIRHFRLVDREIKTMAIIHVNIK